VTANEMIRALRESADVEGDKIQAEMCEIALSGEDSDGSGTTLGRPMTASDARAECLRVCRQSEVDSVDVPEWCVEASIGDYLAIYWEGEKDPGSRCGWSDSSISDVRARLARRGLTLRADDRGLVVGEVRS
jgi:hypothetical protein